MPRRLYVGCAAYAICYAALSILRFSTFHAQIDLSYYIRIVWGLAYAHHDVPLVASPNLIGLHAEPILIPFALLARLHIPIAPLLLVTQAVAVSLLPLPLFRFAQRHLSQTEPQQSAIAAKQTADPHNASRNEKWSLWLALGSLLYPTVTVATLHDFHPVTLALPFLAAFLDAIDEANHRRALLFGALALACREDIALQLALTLSGFAMLRAAQRRMYLLIGGLLFLYFAVYIVVIQPRYLPSLGSYALHFASTGTKVSSGRDLLMLLLHHPLRFLADQLRVDRLAYVAELLWPLAFLPLLGVRFSIGTIPILGINFLSAFPRVRSIESHYTTAMVPFLLFAAIYGLCRLRPLFLRARHSEKTTLAVGLVLALLFVSHLRHGASPLARWGTRYSTDLFVKASDDAQVRAALALVPEHASVAARPGPLAHLAARPRVISPPEYDDGKPVDVILTPDAAPREARIGGQRIIK